MDIRRKYVVPQFPAASKKGRYLLVTKSRLNRVADLTLKDLGKEVSDAIIKNLEKANIPLSAEAYSAALKSLGRRIGKH